MNYRKIAFYLSCVFVLLLLVWGTALQALPFVIIMALTYLNSYGKKDLKILIAVIAVIMLILNLTIPPSFEDAIAWLAIGGLSLVKE